MACTLDGLHNVHIILGSQARTATSLKGAEELAWNMDALDPSAYSRGPLLLVLTITHTNARASPFYLSPLLCLSGAIISCLRRDKFLSRSCACSAKPLPDVFGVPAEGYREEVRMFQAGCLSHEEHREWGASDVPNFEPEGDDDEAADVDFQLGEFLLLLLEFVVRAL